MENVIESYRNHEPERQNEDRSLGRGAGVSTGGVQKEPARWPQAKAFDGLESRGRCLGPHSQAGWILRDLFLYPLSQAKRLAGFAIRFLLRAAFTSADRIF